MESLQRRPSSHSQTFLRCGRSSETQRPGAGEEDRKIHPWKSEGYAVSSLIFPQAASLHLSPEVCPTSPYSFSPSSQQVHLAMVRYHEAGRFCEKDQEWDQDSALFHLAHAAECGELEAIVGLGLMYSQLPHHILSEVILQVTTGSPWLMAATELQIFRCYVSEAVQLQRSTRYFFLHQR